MLNEDVETEDAVVVGCCTVHSVCRKLRLAPVCKAKRQRS